MSWLDPRWQYHAAATHADSQAFRERQAMRAVAAAIVKRHTDDVENVEVVTLPPNRPLRSVKRGK
jgi:hypothetical protein